MMANSRSNKGGPAPPVGQRKEEGHGEERKREGTPVPLEEHPKVYEHDVLIYLNPDERREFGETVRILSEEYMVDEEGAARLVHAAIDQVIICLEETKQTSSRESASRDTINVQRELVMPRFNPKERGGRVSTASLSDLLLSIWLEDRMDQATSEREKLGEKKSGRKK